MAYIWSHRKEAPVKTQIKYFLRLHGQPRPLASNISEVTLVESMGKPEVAAAISHLSQRFVSKACLQGSLRCGVPWDKQHRELAQGRLCSANPTWTGIQMSVVDGGTTPALLEQNRKGPGGQSSQGWKLTGIRSGMQLSVPKASIQFNPGGCKELGWSLTCC